MSFVSLKPQTSRTYVELATKLVVVTDLKVSEDAGLVQVAKLDHVLNAMR